MSDAHKFTDRLDNGRYHVWWDDDMIRVELMEGGEVKIVMLLTEKQRDGLVYWLMNPTPRTGRVNGDA